MATKNKSSKTKQFKSAIAALDWLAEQGVDRVIATPERPTSIRSEVEDLRKYLGGNYDVIVRENDEYDPPKYEVTCKDRGTIDYLETYESAKKRAADREHERVYRESLVAEKNPIIERKLDEAEAMQLFIWCISRGFKPEIIKVSVPNGEPLEIGLVGAHRPCGGVVITRNGSVMSANRWCSENTSDSNPFMQWLVSRVCAAQAKAADNAKELSANYLNAKNVWFDI